MTDSEKIPDFVKGDFIINRRDVTVRRFCECCRLVVAVCREFPVWFCCPAAAGRTDPGSARLSLSSLIWQAGTVAM